MTQQATGLKEVGEAVQVIPVKRRIAAENAARILAKPTASGENVQEGEIARSTQQTAQTHAAVRAAIHGMRMMQCVKRRVRPILVISACLPNLTEIHVTEILKTSIHVRRECKKTPAETFGFKIVCQRCITKTVFQFPVHAIQMEILILV
jgi:hypothetical protein